MNNQTTTDETMSKIADATRLRTRQLLRFSQGLSQIVFAIILLAVGFAYIRNDHEWLENTILFIITAWIFVGYKVEAAMRKKIPLRADAYRGSVLQQVIAIGIFILFVMCYVVFQIIRISPHPWSFNNILPGMIICSILCLGNFTIFIDARLPEDLAGSIAFLGLTLANIYWPWWNNFGMFLIVWGLITLSQGVILHIRWHRSARQISDEILEEKAT